MDTKTLQLKVRKVGHLLGNIGNFFKIVHLDDDEQVFILIELAGVEKDGMDVESEEEEDRYGLFWISLAEDEVSVKKIMTIYEEGF